MSSLTDLATEEPALGSWPRNASHHYRQGLNDGVCAQRLLVLRHKARRPESGLIGSPARIQDAGHTRLCRQFVGHNDLIYVKPMFTELSR